MTKRFSAARSLIKIDSPSKLLVSTATPFSVALITERPTASMNVENPGLLQVNEISDFE
jgi:hypothetical protein